MLQMGRAADLRTGIASRLRAHAALFDRLARRVRQKLLDEPVHDLRVLTRRLRADLWIARHLSSTGPLDEVRRLLRRLGRRLGERRVLDVAMADAAAYGLDGAPLAERHALAGAAVARRLKPETRNEAVDLLRRVARAVDRDDDDRLADGIARRAEKLREALAAAPRGKAELHELRIEAKKARYVLEALGRDSDFLKELQRRLGRAHDLEMLQTLLGPDEAAGRDEERERAAARRIMSRVVRRALKELA